MSIVMYLLAVLMMVIVDQAVKYWAVTMLASIGTIPLIPGVLSLTYVENRGAAFSILENQIWLFVALAVVILCGIVYALKTDKIQAPIGKISLLVIAAGAIGNVIDRVVNHYVVDMIQLEFIRFPIFNIAGYLCLCRRCLICLLLSLYPQRCGGSGQMRRIIQVTETDSGQRIDKLLSQQLPELTRSAIQHLMQDGCVTIGEQPVKKNAKAAAGDVIAVEVPEPKEVSIEPENIPLDIVYEDEDIIVVNKPKGMVVHPAPGNWSGTLVNALMYHCGDSLSGINGEIRPGIVHRIDQRHQRTACRCEKRPRASVAGGTDSSAQRGTPLFCCGLWMPAGGNRHNTSADCPAIRSTERKWRFSQAVGKRLRIIRC